MSKDGGEELRAKWSAQTDAARLTKTSTAVTVRFYGFTQIQE